MADQRRVEGLTEQELDRFEKRMTRLVQLTHTACSRYLMEIGEASEPLRAMVELQTAARRVVWASHPWRLFEVKAAIEKLEDIVGRPERESDI